MTISIEKMNRRWLRFSLRSLFLLMLVIAVALGWTVYKVRQQGIAIAALEKVGCTVYFDGEDSSRSAMVLEWLRKVLGEKESRCVTCVQGDFSQIKDAGLVNLRELTLLRQVYLSGTQVTDAGLVHLRGLTKLQKLELYNTQVTDAGLVHLRGLIRLTRLNLAGTPVTNAELQRLQKALPNCEINWQP